MIHTRHPWFAVMPWAQVDMFDAADVRPWTVLPFSGLRDTPGTLVRELWRQPFERRVITPNPYAPATLVEPEVPDAIATMFAQFAYAEVLSAGDDRGQIHFAPVLTDLFLIGEHLSRDHAQPTERLALNVKTLHDRQLYHAGLHQQVAMYPLPRPHWHR